MVSCSCHVRQNWPTHSNSSSSLDWWCVRHICSSQTSPGRPETFRLKTFQRQWHGSGTTCCSNHLQSENIHINAQSISVPADERRVVLLFAPGNPHWKFLKFLQAPVDQSSTHWTWMYGTMGKRIFLRKCSDLFRPFWPESIFWRVQNGPLLASKPHSSGDNCLDIEIRELRAAPPSVLAHWRCLWASGFQNGCVPVGVLFLFLRVQESHFCPLFAHSELYYWDSFLRSDGVYRAHHLHSYLIQMKMAANAEYP